MLSLSFGLFVMSALNKLEVLAEIPTDSIDYWIGNISPRCAINIIYFEQTNDFIFNSVHNIPVLFLPLKFHNDTTANFDYLLEHQHRGISLRFMKAECYFSILYYKKLNNFDNDPSYDSKLNARYLKNVIDFIAYGYPNYNFDSNSTYCLILYHSSEWNDDFHFWISATMEMNLALVYLSNSSKSGYNFLCKTPSSKFQVSASNVVNKVTSIIDQKFMVTCSSRYTSVVINVHTKKGGYNSKLLVFEHKIIASMILKANVSIYSKAHSHFDESDYGNSRLILSDLQEDLSTSLLFPTFDDSIRFFTCYTLPVLSFHFYVSAFELEVWIAIILSGILIASFLKWHIHYNLSKTLNFSTLLFYFSIFMEEAYSVPLIIRNNKVYRTATILWLLTAIMLTNTYISHVISGLNAPLKGEKLKNNDLYGYSGKEPEMDLEYVRDLRYLQGHLFHSSRLYFAKFGHFVDYLESIRHNQTSTFGYTILSEPKRLSYPKDAWLYIRNPYIYRFFFNILLQIRPCFSKNVRRRSLMYRTFSSLIKPTNKFYLDANNFKRPWNYRNYPTGAVEEELVKCQKSVYAEESDQLEFKYMSGNYRMKRFYYLQDSFSFVPKQWGFYNLQKSKLPFYFSMFLQSGIFHELHKLKLLGDQLKRRSMTSEIIKRSHKPEVLDLTSSVQTVFILYAAMVLLAKISFVAESCYFMYKNYSIALLKMKLSKFANDCKLTLSYLLQKIIKRKPFK